MSLYFTIFTNIRVQIIPSGLKLPENIFFNPKIISNV